MKSKLKYILPIVGILIIAVIILALVFLKEESYRVIQVSNVEGSAEVDRLDIGKLDAYAGMMLQSEDDVEVQSESYLYLKLDEDKYIMAEPGSKMHLKATGNSTNSKTVIQLAEGAVVSRLNTKLSEESVYEIATPNSTMAVRGTVFRVEIVTGEDGTVETQVDVFEGEVTCSLIQPDGTQSEEEILIMNDKAVVIRNEEGKTVMTEKEPDYEDLETNILEFILQSATENEDNEMSEETEELIRNLLSDKTKTTYTITFRHEGKVFATQKVAAGEFVVVPVFLPSLEGSWDYDFTKPVEQDTIIDWKE